MMCDTVEYGANTGSLGYLSKLPALIFVVILFGFYRSVLDFDFEKLCSISLSHINAYACLVCGKYFQGK